MAREMLSLLEEGAGGWMCPAVAGTAAMVLASYLHPMDGKIALPPCYRPTGDGGVWYPRPTFLSHPGLTPDP